MSYEIRWDKKALEFLRKLNKTDARRIIKKVNDIKDYPAHFLEGLTEINSHKLRIGDYRVIIDLNETDKIVSVVLIGHRKDIYKRLRRGK
ncbi:MAG: type II toxin-antitoxin system RelE/ParE family toxin [Candidatus Thermoplasmatota archaeon]|nr:type II toxin-antitoxin system RelE/ParE family toxin [Candidatus Thermoplasmatota archaeon]